MHFLLSALAFVASATSQTAPLCRPICDVPSQYAYSNGTADDAPAINFALSLCARGGVVRFAEGVDYSVLTPVSATNLTNVTIEMKGNLHLPQNITYMQTIFNQSGLSNLYWFTFSGPGIQYVGSSNVSAGWIYSYGQAWWDANIYPGTGLSGRPHLMSFTTTNGSMQYYKSRKPIAWNVQLSGTNITVSDTFIDAFSTTGSFPFNTDGFDVTGKDITITNSVIYNGDDAIAVQSGSSNILFEHGTIGYQSHGMSIGSLGQNQAQYATVSNVTFNDVTVINAVYASRFKSWEGGQGLAKNITWSNIRAYNVTFPIFVTQTYINQGSSQTQIGNGATSGRPNNATVNMQDFRWVNFTGTINTFRPGDGSCVTDPCWYNVGLPNLTHTEAIIVECNTNTSCVNFEMTGIEIIPQSLDAPTVICLNATAALNSDLGFDCSNGTFVPTYARASLIYH
ncbi:glycoside hydrolase family 28 protein [Baudoinia panamericana UAMH 10762]|uniref:galacturonan 1,4-alpha-galacturonidase n=1 Tax=Baudoinia panamericana (strain UAMH 10762) TaxID=717646 RepID=M2N1Z8_BAUPA|nr:glycoside hydrolase family 28 protein [Baudoinia panamericana UAMH 10762]EMC97953.1 glycoside hydrolase family 28 protein [Baudoinia panamericana UAMH 10762]